MRRRRAARRSRVTVGKGVLYDQRVERLKKPKRQCENKQARSSRFRGSGGGNRERLIEIGAINRVRRILTLSAGLVVVFFVLSARLYILQARDHHRWLKLAANQHTTSVKIQGARGPIYDSEGRALAVSVASLSIGAHPRNITDKKLFSKRMAAVLGVSESELFSRVDNEKSFTWLGRGLPLSTEEALTGFSSSELSYFRGFRRYYPQGSIAGPIIGRVSREGAGQSGVELEFNEELLAASRKIPARRDALGRLVTVFPERDTLNSSSLFRLASLRSFSGAGVGSYASPEEEQLRQEGSEVSLTIDSFVQSVLEEEFSRGSVESEAKRVFGMMMDAETGEILGLAQAPTVNPNHFDSVTPDALRNVVLQDSFEPGSTLKPLVAALALDKGVVSTSETMDCTEDGRYRFGRHTIKDVHPVGIVQFPAVLVRSSNICMTQIGERLGRKALHKGLSSFGFGEATGLELKGESGGILRDERRWRAIDVATHSFGQGVAVTVPQLVTAYAALANGGVLVKPTLIQRESEFPRTRVLSREVADEVSQIIIGVTEDAHGTAKRAKITGVRVHGKTGTAQKAKTDGRGYEPDKVISSFVGYVDGYQIGLNRKLVMAVVVDEPGVKPRWGGTVAAPVFRRVMKRVLSYQMALNRTPITTAKLQESTPNAS